MFNFNVVPVAVHLGYKPVSHVRATSMINKHHANFMEKIMIKNCPPILDDYLVVRT